MASSPIQMSIKIIITTIKVRIDHDNCDLPTTTSRIIITESVSGYLICRGEYIIRESLGVQSHSPSQISWI